MNAHDRQHLMAHLTTIKTAGQTLAKHARVLAEHASNGPSLPARRKGRRVHIDRQRVVDADERRAAYTSMVNEDLADWWTAWHTAERIARALPPLPGEDAIPHPQRWATRLHQWLTRTAATIEHSDVTTTARLSDIRTAVDPTHPLLARLRAPDRALAYFLRLPPARRDAWLALSREADHWLGDLPSMPIDELADEPAEKGPAKRRAGAPRLTREARRELVDQYLEWKRSTRKADKDFADAQGISLRKLQKHKQWIREHDGEWWKRRQEHAQ